MSNRGFFGFPSVLPAQPQVRPTGPFQAQPRPVAPSRGVFSAPPPRAPATAPCKCYPKK